jgi:hypothetical protein
VVQGGGGELGRGAGRPGPALNRRGARAWRGMHAKARGLAPASAARPDGPSRAGMAARPGCGASVDGSGRGLGPLGKEEFSFFSKYFSVHK